MSSSSSSPLQLAALALGLLAQTANGHICLLYPMQRGAPPTLTPGDPACFNRVADCGALKKGAPKATFLEGTPYELHFQQNLNHWYPPNPGHFDFAISYDADADATWEPLGDGPISDFPANNMNTQTFFDVPVVFTKAGNATIRGRYVSHNPDEIDPANNTEAIFYTCADVEVVPLSSVPSSVSAKTTDARQSSSQEDAATVDETTATVTATAAIDVECEVPKRWRALGVETIIGHPASAHVNHEIYFDSDAGWIRWQRWNKQAGLNITDLWNLTYAAAGYTPQYILGMKGPGSCSLYGGDKFFPWAYGAKNGMEYLHHFTNGSKTFAAFGIPSADFLFEVEVARNDTANTGAIAECLPRRISHGVLSIEFEAQEVASIDPRVFEVPAICKSKDGKPDGGCKGHASE